jgi:hypothetical protein
MNKNGERVECCMNVPPSSEQLGECKSLYESVLAGVRKYRADLVEADEGPYGYIVGDATDKAVGYGALGAHEAPENIARLACMFIGEGFTFGFLDPAVMHAILGGVVVSGSFDELRD